MTTKDTSLRVCVSATQSPGLLEVSTDRRNKCGEYFLYTLYATSDIPIMLKNKKNTELCRNFTFVYDLNICTNQNLLKHRKIL